MAFTPIDLISSLAALNKGDVQGFRQPWSKEGRQQTLMERQQQTQLLQQHQAILDHINSLPVEQRPGAVENLTKVLGNQAFQARLPFIGPEAQAGLESTRAGTAQTQAQTRGVQTQQDLLKQYHEWFNNPATQEFLRSKTGAPATTGNMPPQAFGELSGLQQKEKQLQIEKEHGQGSVLSTLAPYFSMDPVKSSQLFSRVGELTGMKSPDTSPTANPGLDVLRMWMEQRGQPKPPGAVEGVRRNAVESLSDEMAKGLGQPGYQAIQAKLGDLTPLIQQLIQGGMSIPQNTGNEDLRKAMELIRQLSGQ